MAIERIAREFAASYGHAMDACKKMSEQLAILIAHIESQNGEPVSGGELYRRADAAAGELDAALSKIRAIAEGEDAPC